MESRVVEEDKVAAINQFGPTVSNKTKPKPHEPEVFCEDVPATP